MRRRRAIKPATPRATPNAPLQVATVHATAERQAEDVAARISPHRDARPATPAPVSAQQIRAPLRNGAQGGQPLSPVARAGLEPALNRDLTDVRLHTGSQAAQATKDLRAQAVTLGRDIHFAPGAYAPHTSKGRNLLVHEIAHTLQPSGNTAHRKALADLKPAIHKKLRFSRVAPKKSTMDARIKQYFAPAGGVRVTGIKPEWSANITDANEQRGLTSLANKLISESRELVTKATATTPEKRENSDPATWSLGTNSILELELNLLAHGNDHAIYRFTRYTESKTGKLLIEKTKVIASPPSATKGTAATTGQSEGASKSTQKPVRLTPTTNPNRPPPTYTGTVSVGAISIEIGSGFSNDRGKIIADAAALLPPPIREKVDGVTFAYKGSGIGPTGENGHYDQEKDTINIWGDMFKASHRKIGEASDSAYQVVHELTHVIDQRPMFKAKNESKALEKKVKAMETERDKISLDLDADLFGDVETKDKTKLKADIAAAKKEITRLKKEAAKAKSVAGDELGTNTKSLTTAFGKALKKDGVTAIKNATKDTLKGGVSLYANTDLMEAFAENFSYYLLNEDAFKLLRPNTHAFFAKNYPKTKGKP